MAIDLSIIAPKARENYLRIRRQFGSTDTINQASKTLEGCDTYIGVLKLHGFSAADRQRLADGRQVEHGRAKPGSRNGRARHPIRQ